MKTFDEFVLEVKGEHDNSKVYDDLYSDVEKHLKRWAQVLFTVGKVIME